MLICSCLWMFYQRLLRIRVTFHKSLHLCCSDNVRPPQIVPLVHLVFEDIIEKRFILSRSMISWVICHACSYYTKTSQAEPFLNRSQEQPHCLLVFYWHHPFICILMHGLEDCVLMMGDMELLYTGPLLSKFFPTTHRGICVR